jgi:hypothetical protein
MRNAPFMSSHRMMGTKQVAASGKSERNTLVLIAAIVAVVIVLPIVLAVILYVMVLGFGGSDNYTPAVYLARTSVADGYMFTFSAPSRDIYWSDVTIRLSDYYDFVSWDPLSSDLDGGFASTMVYSVKTLGGDLQVVLNVTDAAGNGMIDSGDYFTLTAGGGTEFSSGVEYEAMVLYQPTGESICISTFSQ